LGLIICLQTVSYAKRIAIIGSASRSSREGQGALFVFLSDGFSSAAR